MKYTILYNSLSDNKNGLDNAKAVESLLENAKGITYADWVQLDDKISYINSLPEDETVVICGGDGSLNHFVTELDDKKMERDIYYFPCGSGNDFARDVFDGEKKALIHLNEYINDLPKVTVKGKEYRYINDVGFGIDGYVCEEADKLRKTTNKPINYPLIAIKGFLFRFRTKTAKVVVDGKEYTFERVVLASTFNGRFYGGGMQIAPMQDRKNKEHTQTFVCLHNCRKVKGIIVFAGVFSLKHLKYKKNVTFLTGKEIEVTFDTPSAIQLDGEVVKDVLSYKIKA
ncbi:MAG: diacylglycerol kinase family protein [Lachnospiraceae bacterium]|nr:diacylglycerol kinase family protein [Lachnospiraceae bacterium]